MTEEVIKNNVVLLGDSGVGKTSLIRRFVVDDFSDKFITTIGTKVSKKEVTLDVNDSTIHMVMMIWDIIGQKGYRYTQSLSFRGMRGALLVADLTDKETLGSLKDYWIPLITENTGPIPMVFLANKADLVDQHEFGKKELEDMAVECGSTARCFFTSAKTGELVDAVFYELGQQVTGTTEKSKFKTEFDPMAERTVPSYRDALDRIIADFSDQFGGIEHATPYIKQQMKMAKLDLSNPQRNAIVDFVDRLAELEKGYKDPATVQKNKYNRLRLFGYTNI